MARRRARMKQDELAAALGGRYDQSVISKVERGLSALLADGLTKAARVLGVSTDYLLGLTDNPTPAAQLLPALALAVQGTDVVAVRDVRAAAGWGAAVEAEPVIGHMAFSRRWLQRHRLQPEQCSVIEILGDSMEPLLEDGCWVLVDHGRNALASGRVFAIWTGDGLLVKRAARVGGRWRMLSENASYGSLPLPRESRVVGEVKWAGRSL